MQHVPIKGLTMVDRTVITTIPLTDASNAVYTVCLLERGETFNRYLMLVTNSGQTYLREIVLNSDLTLVNVTPETGGHILTGTLVDATIVPFSSTVVYLIGRYYAHVCEKVNGAWGLSTKNPDRIVLNSTPDNQVAFALFVRLKGTRIGPNVGVVTSASLASPTSIIRNFIVRLDPDTHTVKHELVIPDNATFTYGTYEPLNINIFDPFSIDYYGPRKISDAGNDPRYCIFRETAVSNNPLNGTIIDPTLPVGGQTLDVEFGSQSRIRGISEGANQFYRSNGVLSGNDLYIVTHNANLPSAPNVVDKLTYPNGYGVGVHKRMNVVHRDPAGGYVAETYQYTTVIKLDDNSFLRVQGRLMGSSNNVLYWAPLTASITKIVDDSTVINKGISIGTYHYVYIWGVANTTTVHYIGNDKSKLVWLYSADLFSAGWMINPTFSVISV